MEQMPVAVCSNALNSQDQTDVLYMNSPGDKSEVLDVVSPDLKRFPEFVKAKRYECVLEPGDLLFIPGKTNMSTLTSSSCNPTST